jgi:hypothetical protein
MADAVTTNVIFQNAYHYIVHLTNISDGTGESNVIKVDKSALTVAQDGAEAAAVDIEQCRWAIQGMNSVRLSWDHNTDDMALVLSGSGYDDFRGLDKGAIGITQTSGLKDPRSTGGTGDLLLTTNGQASGSTYDITLWIRKAND